MWRRLCAPGLIAIALLPASWLAWNWRSMPHLGFYHDDGLYLVCAKSLAEGHGYRIQSLPGEPLQTKYPPLFPLILSIVWKSAGAFPANLPAEMFLVWCFYVACVALMWLTFGELVPGRLERTALTVVAALNPVMILFGLSLMPEMLFITLFLAAILLAPRSPGIAGLVGGLAFLTKTAGLPLLVSIPICYLLKKRFHAAVCFTAVMLPAVAGWNLWIARHLTHSTDLVTLYYTDYAGFRKLNVPLNNLPLVMWRNLDAFLTGAGTLLTFDVALWEWPFVERMIGLAAIAGALRLSFRARNLEYPFVALLFSMMLLVWHYPPNERFLLPLYPMLLAGFAVEMKFVGRAIHGAWTGGQAGHRLAAGAMAVAVSSVLLYSGAGTIAGDFAFLPKYIESRRSSLEKQRAAYRWLTRHTTEQANVFAYQDPLIFLYTGRHACSLRIPPRLVYTNDAAGIRRLLTGVPRLADEHHIEYLFLTPRDFQLDLPQSQVAEWSSIVRTTPVFQEAFRSADTAIYRLAR